MRASEFSRSEGWPEEAIVHWLGIPIDVNVSERFASREDGFREELRKELSRELVARGEVSDASWQDLSIVPSSTSFWVSLSHCAGAGGLAICSKNRPLSGLGFDVEIASRLNERNVLRVSSPEELERSPGPDILWGAKEAGYKSIRMSSQPATVAPIEPQNWQSLAEDIWGFEIHFTGQDLEIPSDARQDVDFQIKGLAWNFDEFCFSLAVSK